MVTGASTMRPALTISLYLAGRKVVLVGAGPAADERLRRLAGAGAETTCIAPAAYEPTCLAGAFLVLAQSGDAALDRRVADDARKAGALVYVHDQPEASDLAMPALARHGPVELAITTSGQAPALAGRLRQELQDQLDRGGADLDRLLARMAAERGKAGPGDERRRRLAALAARLVLTGAIIVLPLDEDSSDEGR